MGDSLDTENEYERLSRDIHQMQLTGAIRQDWLDNPKGYLFKPDFKRKEQMVSTDARGRNWGTNPKGFRLHMPLSSTFKKRWFVLDRRRLTLKYYKSEQEEQELGMVHLASVNATLPSRIADAPPHSLDLVCADRIYTIAGESREDMVRWALVLTQVLRGETSQHRASIQMRPTASRRRVDPIKENGLLKSGAERGGEQGERRLGSILTSNDFFDLGDDVLGGERWEEEMNEEVISITITEPGPLYINLRGTVDEEVMVSGFSPTPTGEKGPAEKTGLIQAGDLLVGVNEHKFSSINFDDAIQLIKREREKENGRGITLRFLRLDSRWNHDTPRFAEGWVLVKDNDSAQFRLRLLQLNGSRLFLYKPALFSGRMDDYVSFLLVDKVSDIRPKHDKRSIAREKIAGYTKEWGVTLEGSDDVLTFFTRTQEDAAKWINLLKNLPLSNGQARQRPIPVHPLSVIEQEAGMEGARVLKEGELFKLSDLTGNFRKRNFKLFSGGIIKYYKDSHAIRAMGHMKLAAMTRIVMYEYEGPGITEYNKWRVVITVQYTENRSSLNRDFVISSDDRILLVEWAKLIAQEAKDKAGRSFNVDEVIKVQAKSPQGLAYAGELSARTRGASIGGMMSPFHLRPVDPSAPEDRSAHLLELGESHLLDGWMFVKCPQEVGLGSYRRRFVVLRGYELHFYKYEILMDEYGDQRCGCIDMRLVQDVREVEEEKESAQDNALEIVLTNGTISTVVFDTDELKEIWHQMLSKVADFFQPPRREKNEGRGSGAQRLSGGANKGANGGGSSRPLTDIATIKGWLEIEGSQVFATITGSIFCAYAREQDVYDEWKDPLFAINLSLLSEVASARDRPEMFFLSVSGQDPMAVAAIDKESAKLWMQALTIAAGLVLAPSGKGWISTEPFEGWLWKFDDLNKVYRQRWFSLRSDKLVFQRTPKGRQLCEIPLRDIRGFKANECIGSKHAETEFRLTLRVVSNLETMQLSPTANQSDSPFDYEAALLGISIGVAFDSKEALFSWADAIYAAAVYQSLSAGFRLDRLDRDAIESYPEELLVESYLETEEESAAEPEQIYSRARTGWMWYYRHSEAAMSAPLSRFFVLMGSELAIYKHEVSIDEIGIHYGIIDLTCLEEVVPRHDVNAPENAIDLHFTDGGIITLVARTDAQELTWLRALKEAKVMYGYEGSRRHKLGATLGGLLREEGDQRRRRIDQTVTLKGSMREWEGRKWIEQFYVIAGNRFIAFSSPSHLYEEEADALFSLHGKLIKEIRSSTAGGVNPEVCFDLVTRQGNLLLQCQSDEECYQWMKTLAQTHGKLELRPREGTKLWKSALLEGTLTPPSEE